MAYGMSFNLRIESLIIRRFISPDSEPLAILVSISELRVLLFVEERRGDLAKNECMPVSISELRVLLFVGKTDESRMVVCLGFNLRIESLIIRS